MQNSSNKPQSLGPKALIVIVAFAINWQITPNHEKLTMHNLSTIPKSALTTLIFLQFFDAVIHLATDQLEPLRITANGAIILWSTAVWIGSLKDQHRPTALAALGTYLILNAIFLTQHGLTNPEQGNSPRTLLFLLLTGTSMLVGWIIWQMGYRQKPKGEQHV